VFYIIVTDKYFVVKNIKERKPIMSTATLDTPTTQNTGVEDTRTPRLDDELEIIHIVHNANEDKPWELKFDDVSGLKKARAILNYPVHKFETEAKALEVAEMLRGIIKADGIEIDSEARTIFDNDKASFFHPVGNERQIT
jgi:hypothetical protein